MRILLVEDHRDFRDLMREVLTVCGHEVETVDDGGQARTAFLLGRCQGIPFDLIISDVEMPGMGGFALYRCLAHELGHCRFLLMTASPAVSHPGYRRLYKKRIGIRILLKEQFVDRVMSAMSGECDLVAEMLQMAASPEAFS